MISTIYSSTPNYPINLGTYSYNSQGVRYKKETHNSQNSSILSSSLFYLDGSKILGEDRLNGTKLRYYYDISGICGIEYNGTKYDVVCDIQGNVVKIFDNAWTMVQYEYDAWGECKTITNVADIALANPFRWKSYYFDTETGFYYIDGRYYDSNTGLFINACNPIELVYNSTQVCGLNAYNLGTTNPLIFPSNGHNCMSSIPLFSDVPGEGDIGWLGKFFKWYNGIHWGWKVGIGTVLFAGAIGLNALTGGSVSSLFVTMGVSVVSGALIQGGITAATGGNFWDGALDGAIDGYMWGGIFSFGQAVGRAIQIARYGVVIGESMGRVNAAAQEIGAATYEAPGKYLVRVLGKEAAFEANKTLNRLWVERMVRWGVRIINIGLDVTRSALTRSPFYALEATAVIGYWNLIPMFWPAIF